MENGKWFDGLDGKRLVYVLERLMADSEIYVGGCYPKNKTPMAISLGNFVARVERHGVNLRGGREEGVGRNGRYGVVRVRVNEGRRGIFDLGLGHDRGTLEPTPRNMGDVIQERIVEGVQLAIPCDDQPQFPTIDWPKRNGKREK